MTKKKPNKPVPGDETNERMAMPSAARDAAFTVTANRTNKGMGLPSGVDMSIAGPVAAPSYAVDQPDWKGFALAVLIDSRDNLGSDVDGGMVQDAAAVRGLLVKVQALEPCGDSCMCAEYDSFPQDCYRYSRGTLKAIADAARPTASVVTPAPVQQTEAQRFEDYFCGTLSDDGSENDEVREACRVAAHDAWQFRSRLAAPIQQAAPSDIDDGVRFRFIEQIDPSRWEITEGSEGEGAQRQTFMQWRWTITSDYGVTEWDDDIRSLIDGQIRDLSPEDQALLLLLPAATAAPAQPVGLSEQDKLDAVRAALNGYYDALTARQHGGIAQNRAFNEIETALGMSWEARKAEVLAAKEAP